MRTGIWIVFALLLATAARAAEESKPDETGRKSAAELARERMEQRRATQKGAGHPVDKKKASAEAAAAANRAAVARAKSVYMFAIEACEQPKRCDAALRDEAEQRFSEACRACAADERCDAEVQAIKDGSATASVNPCATAARR